MRVEGKSCLEIASRTWSRSRSSEPSTLHLHHGCHHQRGSPDLRKELDLLQRIPACNTSRKQNRLPRHITGGLDRLSGMTRFDACAAVASRADPLLPKVGGDRLTRPAPGLFGPAEIGPSNKLMMDANQWDVGEATDARKNWPNWIPGGWKSRPA